MLTRQSLPQQERNQEQFTGISRGGYVLRSDPDPELILIATGSEVPLAVAAADLLKEEGRRVRVVSMPCVSLDREQDEAWKESVIPSEVKARVVIEAGVTAGWLGLTGRDGAVVGIDEYGASAPASQLFEHFGFTPEQVVKIANQVLARC